MNRTIVLAARPGPRAHVTAEAAAWLARELDAAVTLVYVAQELATAEQVSSATGMSTEAVRARMLEEVESQIRAMVAEHMPGIEPTLRFEEGNAVERITACAAELGASLLVVGTHGRTGASRLVLGDMTDQILKAATCPVVVVPRTRTDGEG